MSVKIVIGPGAQKHHVRFGFGMVVQVDGILNLDGKTVAGQTGEDSNIAENTPGMANANGRHYNNYPLNQFHPFLRVENAGLAHPVVFGNGELAGCDGFRQVSGEVSAGLSGFATGARDSV